MSTDTELELYRIMHDSRQKYVYFLLAAVGACIGFSVTQTRDAQITCYEIPLGIAVVCWALSFFFGCRYLHKKSVSVGTNIELLRLRRGANPIAGSDLAAVAMGVEILEKDFGTTNSQVGFAYRWQFRLFLVAGAAFLVWHILGMWQRTIA